MEGCVSCKTGLVPAPIVEARSRAIAARHDFALTMTELAVLESLAKGFDTFESARRMQVSGAAVLRARARIAEKLKVVLLKGWACGRKNDELLLAAARKRGLIAFPETSPISPGDAIQPACAPGAPASFGGGA